MMAMASLMSRIMVAMAFAAETAAAMASHDGDLRQRRRPPRLVVHDGKRCWNDGMTKRRFLTAIRDGKVGFSGIYGGDGESADGSDPQATIMTFRRVMAMLNQARLSSDSEMIQTSPVSTRSHQAGDDTRRE
jgi:hypothetical protein